MITQETYDIVTENFREVYDVFKEFFGEDYVDTDLPSCEQVSNVANFGNSYKIIVYYPSVVVTNEKGNSTTIKKLFICVPVELSGKMATYGFSMTRSQYSLEEIQADYSHSHLPGISPFFNSPCLGTGPLAFTQRSLQRDYDLNLWRLFCVELDKYVHVESIAGVPYRYLSNIGKSNNGNSRLGPSVSYTNYNRHSLSEQNLNNRLIELFDYIISNLASGKFFRFKENSFEFIDSVENQIAISNFAASWFIDKINSDTISEDEKLKLKESYDLLFEEAVLYKNRLVYKVDQHNRNRFYSWLSNPPHIVDFKGVSYNVEITNVKRDNDTNKIMVLNSEFCSTLFNKICKYLTIKYYLKTYGQGKHKARNNNDLGKIGSL